MTPGDYDAVVNKIIEIDTGDVCVMQRITINQDEFRETDPNEFFFSDIEFNSGIQPINVIRPTANITIDDSEPECGESYK